MLNKRGNPSVHMGVKRPWLSFLMVAVGLQTWADPARILLIRHGEKPEPEDHADPHLSAAGRERARNWVNYFTNSTGETPIALFAPKPTPRHPSVRPIETLEPLAAALKIKVRTPFSSSDYAKLAQQLRADPKLEGRTVVVCWVRQSLPDLAAALGVQPLPAEWSETNYAGVYEVTFSAGKTGFRGIPDARAAPVMPARRNH